MKKLEISQMESLQGSVSTNCGLSLGGALLFGTGAIIAAATGGIGGIAFAMAGSYFGWGMAAYSCS